MASGKARVPWNAIRRMTDVCGAVARAVERWTRVAVGEVTARVASGGVCERLRETTGSPPPCL